MQAPRIAIPTPTSLDTAYNERSWTSYAQAVERTGGVAVRIPLGLSATQLREAAESVQGFCLPGSPADVAPTRYAAEADPASAPPDVQREEVDFALLAHAESSGKPLLAVCFGLQSMNVWRGGSLVQDLTPVPVNHSAGGTVAIAHAVLIAEHSALGRLIAASDETRAEAPLADGFYRLPVNTSHHQAVSEPGTGLRVSARCPDDGVVEALEMHPDEPISGATFSSRLFLGVQWHPERSFDISATSRAMFSQLVLDSSRIALPHMTMAV